MNRSLPIALICAMSGCVSEMDSSVQDLDTQATAPIDAVASSNLCVEGCPEGSECLDGLCKEELCTIECTGTTWCEEGIVRATPTGAIPCDQGAETCDEVTDVLTCDYGCVTHASDPERPESWCRIAPLSPVPEPPGPNNHTFEKIWEPSKILGCDPTTNVSPSVEIASLLIPNNLSCPDPLGHGHVMVEPAILFRDEAFTVVMRAAPGEASIPVPWTKYEVVGQNDPPKLYDDGTHGDVTAGDGLYTRACLSLKAEFQNEEATQKTDDIWWLDPSLRGSETVEDVHPGLRRNDVSYFVSMGDHYGSRRVNDWSIYFPGTCVPCQHAWSTAGDVFDFLVLGTRDAVGLTSYVRVHDNIQGTGLMSPCDANSHCFDIADGKEHQEFLGTIWLGWPDATGLTRELGHGLLGIGTTDFPGPGKEAWNSQISDEIDGDTTLSGVLSGSLWDPNRGWPHAVLLEDEAGNRTKPTIRRDDTGEFRLMPADETSSIWSDIFLYMMGLIPAEAVEETFYKLVNPALSGCVEEEDNLVCHDDHVTAEKVVAFTVEDFISQFGSWSVEPNFKPSNLRLGILNISDRRHTTAEITFLTKVYREYAESDVHQGQWTQSTPWRWSTQGLGEITLITQ